MTAEQADHIVSLLSLLVALGVIGVLLGLFYVVIWLVGRG